MILDTLTRRRASGQKSVAILVDPDKISDERALLKLVDVCNQARIDFIFIGGSLLVQNTIENTLTVIKRHTSIKTVLFPGSNLHINESADAVLFLSLISGRNADLLIGQHVAAAPLLKRSSLEVLATGYILVGNNANTTVAYISQTTPVPLYKPEIAACTAMAGELLGLKLIYLDAGSGAPREVPKEMISKVKKSVDIPLIIGGGINTTEKAATAFEAGADLLVVGTAAENDLKFIYEISTVRDELNVTHS